MQDSMDNQTSVCAALIASSAGLAPAVCGRTASEPARGGFRLRRGAGRAWPVAGIVVLPWLTLPGQQANGPYLRLYGLGMPARLSVTSAYSPRSRGMRSVQVLSGG